MNEILKYAKKSTLDKLTKEQKQIINSIEYTEKDKSLLQKYIRKYIEYGLDFKILKDNWKRIPTLGKSMSLEACIIRYGEHKGKEIREEHIRKTTPNHVLYEEKYGREAVIDLKKKISRNLDSYIQKYGETEGKKRWESYCTKRRETYKERRGTYTRYNLDFFKNRYGEEEGYKIWKNKIDKQAYKVSLQFYIDQYGEVEGRKKCKEAKSRGITYYINKYGEEIGKVKYEEKCKKYKKHLFHGYSKWAIGICEKIKEHLSDLEFYGKNEIKLYISKEDREKLGFKYKTCFKPDLFYKNKIIEFNGDMWHANPAIYESTDTPIPFNDNTAEQIWEIDNKKLTYYDEKGYDYLVIWESEYLNDKEGVIDKCVKFLMN